MLAQAPRLRLSGHGPRLRLRTLGRWRHDPLEDVRECCRASMAVDKALGEAVREAIKTGSSWRDIGRALGASEDADTEADVIDAFANRSWQCGIGSGPKQTLSARHGKSSLRFLT